MTMFLPDAVIFLAGVAGLVVWVLGGRRVGATLIAPAAWRWLIWPLAVPLLADIPWAVWAIAAIIAAPLVPFMIILAVQNWFVKPLFGERAAAHVSATYIVRAIDGCLRAIAWPFRFLFSRAERPGRTRH